jgi:wyosine [tRNA(Phe)-imidazoG37] synthetase (radical SAM superfamily)
MKYKYLFGPINSRRFGLSLGVDLVSFKTCSFDCLYCECGVTDDLTVSKKEYIPVSEIISELKDYLSHKPHVDYITLTGSGEPTLNSKIGVLVDYLKENHKEYKIALLTNGSLIYDKDVVSAIKKIDLVKITLNAASQKVFEAINIPHSLLKIDDIIKGIIDFRKQFINTMWIELFIIPGINDLEEDLFLLKKKLVLMNPDKVHLNSTDRPSAYPQAVKSSYENLLRVKKIMMPLPVEIVSKRSEEINSLIINDKEGMEEAILSMIKRRPSTIEDIVSVSGIDYEDVKNYLMKLMQENFIEEKNNDDEIFYCFKKL